MNEFQMQYESFFMNDCVEIAKIKQISNNFPLMYSIP